MSFFSSGKYSTLKIKTPANSRKREFPEGLWLKCKSCSRTLYKQELKNNLNVCPYCDFHHVLDANERLDMLLDQGTFVELCKNMHSVDVLQFFDTKSYGERLRESEAKSGMNEAIICGEGAVYGKKTAIGVMDFRFMGASMGSVVGEKITELAEHAIANHLPLVLVTASGGARMQEGIISLMQMAKTCGALELLREAKLPYIVILAHPTYGGVTASFASIGDVILAEPGAMIGFAGPRVIEETTNSKLPEGFQTAEFLLEKGLVDRVVHRKNLKEELGLLLEYLQV